MTIDDAAGRSTRPAAFCSGWRGTMLAGLGGLFLLVALCGCLAHFWSTDHPFTLGVVAAAPYLMLAAPAAVVLFALLRSWIALAVAALLLAWAVSTQVGLYIGTAAPADAVPVSVMTANLSLGEADPQSVLQAVRSHGVDLLMLEELTPGEQRSLIAAGLDTVLPYHSSWPEWGSSGTGLWSRYPLSDVRRPAGFTFALVSARVAVPGITPPVSVLALHMPGPVPEPVQWQHDIERLPTVLRTEPADAPVIVGGDFNATPDTSQFRNLLTAGYTDAAAQAGAGMTPTYPSNRWFPPLIAIDHVITRGGAVATDVRTVGIAGSDHRALTVQLALPRAAGL